MGKKTFGLGCNGCCPEPCCLAAVPDSADCASTILAPSNISRELASAVTNLADRDLIGHHLHARRANVPQPAVAAQHSHAVRHSCPGHRDPVPPLAALSSRPSSCPTNSSADRY